MCIVQPCGKVGKCRLLRGLSVFYAYPPFSASRALVRVGSIISRLTAGIVIALKFDLQAAHVTVPRGRYNLLPDTAVSGNHR
jgi:hypothetical protein